MNSNQQYQTIAELSKSIETHTEQIGTGHFTVKQMNQLIEETRELYDRLVVLRYMAYERSVKSGENPDVFEIPIENNSKNLTDQLVTQKLEEPIENTTPATEEPSESETGGLFDGFKLDFSSSNDLKSTKKETQKKPKFVPGKQESIPVPDQPLPFNNPNPPKKIEKPVEPKLEEEVPVVDENQINLINAIDDVPVSINDQMAANQTGDNLAKKLAQQPISDLKVAIGINQKFLFMNDLFKGEHAEYHSAIDKINNMASFQEAESYVQNELLPKFGWDMENVSTENFMNLISRRFY